jgi:hypothetical protein
MNAQNRIKSCIVCAAVILWAFLANAATLPPDPDNAALLYYQAFLHRPDWDTETFLDIEKVLRGDEPSEQVRNYLNQQRCRQTIELVEAAAQIPQCNWGLRYSQGLNIPMQQLSHIRFISLYILEVHARTLAADGDYRSALGQCLTLRKLARHVGDDMLITYLLSLPVDSLAQRCIQYILSSMPLDTDIITWLQGQLSVVKGASESPTRAFAMDFELALQSLRIDHDTLAWIRNKYENPESLTDEDIIALAEEPYADFLNSVFRVIDSEMLYEAKYTELQRLKNELKEEIGSDPAANLMILICSQQVERVFTIHVRHAAAFNALKAALEIYLITAQTGQLPETLPSYLPKDPYSSQDFEYELTSDGFILRCRVKDIDTDEIQQYEFKVQK